MTTATVAGAILEQLGGSRFVAMTGARHITAITDSALLFSLPRRFARNGIDKVRITLTPADLYDMRFYHSKRDLTLDIVAEHQDIYNDQLQAIFTAETGLQTHF